MSILVGAPLTFDPDRAPHRRFHACIIGISVYARGEGDWSPGLLSGAAFGACLFRDYLVQAFKPPGKVEQGAVRLLISPTDNEAEELKKLGHVQGGTYELATYQNVKAALESWAVDCNKDSADIAILYVAGHGVSTSDQARWVFLSNAPKEGDPYYSSINVDQIRRRMSSRRAIANYFIYDACAEVGRHIPMRDADSSSGLGLPRLDQSEPTGIRAYELYTSVHEGTSNYVTKPTKGPILSRALLDLMRTDGGQLNQQGEYVITASAINLQFQSRIERLMTEDRISGLHIEAMVKGEHLPEGISLLSEPPKFNLIYVPRANDQTCALRLFDSKGVELYPANGGAEPQLAGRRHLGTYRAGMYKIHALRGMQTIVSDIPLARDTSFSLDQAGAVAI